MTPRSLPLRLATPIALACLFLLPSCGGTSSSQDITTLVTAVDVKTGWFDAGVENGMNKLVPTIVFALKNTSSETVSQVQLNAVIRRVGETEEWGGAYVKAIGSEGLAPQASTKPIVLRSNLGYTGIEPRNVMLKNSQFVDAHIQIFAKYGGANWAKLGEFPVARVLLTE